MYEAGSSSCGRSAQPRALGVALQKDSPLHSEEHWPRHYEQEKTALFLCSSDF